MRDTTRQDNRLNPEPTGLQIPGRLLLLTLPIAASMISRTVMGFIDFWMVSKLGTEAQAAVMPANVVLFAVISLGMGTMTVINSFVSQSLGREEPRECAAYAWQGFHIAIVMGLLALPFIPLVPWFLGWFAHDHGPVLRELERQYIEIGIVGIGPVVATVALAHFFNGIHRPTVGFFSALIANVFNVFANWVFIFGNLGFPKMGIAGAAIATTLAATFQMLMLMAWMLKPSLADEFGTRQMWRPSWVRIKAVLYYGVPAGLQFSIDIFAWMVFTYRLIGPLGKVPLAAHNVAFQFLHMSFMPTIGLGIATAANVGRYIGQGRRDLARKVVRWAAGFGVAWMSSVGLLYLLARYQLIVLFPVEPQVIPIAADIMVLCAVFQVFDALHIVYIFALRGAGDNHWPAWFMAAMAALVCLGGGWAMVELLPQWGPIGPWTAATVYIMALGVGLWARWRFGPWERIEMIRKPRLPGIEEAEPTPAADA